MKTLSEMLQILKYELTPQEIVEVLDISAEDLANYLDEYIEDNMDTIESRLKDYDYYVCDDEETED